jgi:VWFA-related protein
MFAQAIFCKAMPMNSIDASRTSLFAGRDLRAAWTRALTVLLLGLLWGAPLPLHAQAPATGRISIAGVEDQNFPSVSLFLDMVDANGTPVSGLTAAAFTLQEDGQPALIGALTADPSAPLALLLTLDRSTDVNTWAAVQGAVAATIDALEEEDQVAITTIAEQVQAVQGFTNNQESARNALAGVTPGGQFSAINPALIDAVGRFNDELPPRRAIVLVADAADNISGVTTADTIAQLAGQGIPVYIVGFGDRVQASADFAQIAAATGGGFFPVASANELQATLLSLLQTLRLGYRLDFVSSIQADNQPHAAQVQVNAPTVQGVATADFVARPSTLTVTLPSLVSGQPVAGVINLTAAVTASGPIASVEFRVDDQPIGTTPDPALPVVWDTSSLSPGPHTLSVVVTDVVGNRGEAAVEIRIAAAAPRLDLIGVDSGDFPRVTTFVDAFGANGLPLVGLSGQSFVVSEDNQIVNPAQVTAQVDATQPVHLILVLDTGVTAADWAQVRNAANSMIDGLRPQDQLAIYTFAAVPTLLQGATSDRNQLKAALATVQPTPPTPEANDNGLNQALLDAVNFASTLPTGRRAIVVVTNGLDNSGQIALNDALNVIEAQTTPIHLIGFATDALTAGTLAGIAQVGRGNSVTVNAAADVRSALQTLLLLLQQGYRIGFTSGLQADDLSHSLTVSLAGVGIDAEARSDFIARSRPITLTIPNVTAGSTVAGPVNLTAQAEAAAPLVAVEYRLNGDLLASVADTTFSVIWNSDTVSPGEYTLEVIATDAA